MWLFSLSDVIYVVKPYGFLNHSALLLCFNTFWFYRRTVEKKPCLITFKENNIKYLDYLESLFYFWVCTIGMLAESCWKGLNDTAIAFSPLNSYYLVTFSQLIGIISFCIVCVFIIVYRVSIAVTLRQYVFMIYSNKHFKVVKLYIPDYII